MFELEKSKIGISDQYLFSKAQAAKLLGLSCRAVDQLIKTGLLQCYPVGRYRLFTKQFLLDFVDYVSEVASDMK